MKKIKLLILLYFFLIGLNSCGTVKEAFSTQKKDSTDEFLVEKKNPLNIPPNYDELPVPGNSENIDENKDEKLKELIKKSENSDKKQNKAHKSSKSLEELVLGKIKEN